MSTSGGTSDPTSPGRRDGRGDGPSEERPSHSATPGGGSQLSHTPGGGNLDADGRYLRRDTVRKDRTAVSAAIRCACEAPRDQTGHARRRHRRGHTAPRCCRSCGRPPTALRPPVPRSGQRRDRRVRRTGRLGTRPRAPGRLRPGLEGQRQPRVRTRHPPAPPLRDGDDRSRADGCRARCRALRGRWPRQLVGLRADLGASRARRRRRDAGRSDPVPDATGSADRAPRHHRNACVRAGHRRPGVVVGQQSCVRRPRGTGWVDTREVPEPPAGGLVRSRGVPDARA